MADEKSGIGRTILTFGRDIGTGAFSTIMPATSNTIRDIYGNSMELIKANRKISRRTDQQINTKINNSKNNRDAMALVDQANRDMASGSFSVGRTNNELYQDYDDEISGNFDLKNLTADQRANMSSDDISLMGMEGIAKSVVRSSSAQMETSIKLNESLIKSNIKSNQAVVKSINATILASTNSITTQLLITNNKLDTINKNLVNLLDFQNKNAVKFYTENLRLMQAMNRQFAAYEQSLRGSKRAGLGNYDTSSGFNLREYRDYVKKNLDNSIIGAGLNMAKAGRAVLSGRMGEGIGAFIGNILSSSGTGAYLKKLDQGISLVMDEALKKLRDKLNDPNSKLAALGLGDILGNRRRTALSPDMARYSKEPLPWNGQAQKALVEVIPELLSSIDAGINGTDRRHYDYKQGKWKTDKQIRSEYRREIDSEFATYMDELSSNLKAALRAAGQSEVQISKAMKEMSDITRDTTFGRGKYADHQYAVEQSAKWARDNGLNRDQAARMLRQQQQAIDNVQRGINRINSQIGSQTGNAYNALFDNSDGRNRDYFEQMKRSRTNIMRGTDSYSRSTAAAIHTVEATFKQRYPGFNSLSPQYKKMIANYVQAGTPMQEIIDNMTAFHAQGSRGAIASNMAADWLQNKGKVGRFLAGGIRRFGPNAPVYADPTLEFVHGYTGTAGGIDRIANEAYLRTEGITDYDNLGNGSGYRQGSYWDCGPTALANVSAALGFGISPAQARRYAVKNGYSSRRSGSNAGLFMSTGGRPFGAGNLKQAVRSGPAVISGYGNAPYTRNGHIITTYGVNRYGKPVGPDRNGAMRTYSWNQLGNGFNGGFSYGYGPGGATSIRTDMNAGSSDAQRALDMQQNSIARMGIRGNNATESDMRANRDARSLTMQALSRMPPTAQNLVTTAQLSIASMITSFDDFANNLVGENGFMSKFFSGQLAETFGSSLKQYLFDENEGVFGEQVKQAKAWGSDVWTRTKAQLKKGYNWVYDQYNIGKYGEDYRNNEAWQNSRLNRSIDPLADRTGRRGLNFGKIGDITKSMWDTAKKKNLIPKALATGIAGTIIGGMNAAGGASLVGMMLPGGPIAGAIAGIGLSLLSNTKAFQDVMFGKELVDKDGNPTGERAGGLISQQMRDSFKKAAPTLVKGAVIGGIGALAKGAIGMGGSGLGVLGMQLLPGGILGGAILGAGIGMLKNNEAFMTRIFGPKDADGKRSGSGLSKLWNSFNSKFKDANLKETLKGVGAKAFKGGAVGVLTGATLANLGVLPAMFSLGGPVGMGLAGLGVGIASSSKKFDEWLFGTKELDEEGNETGRRTSGFLQRTKNMFITSVWDPISDSFRKNMVNMIDWTKSQIMRPFQVALGPIIDNIKEIKDNIVETIRNTIEKIGEGVKSIVEGVAKRIFTPLTKIFGKALSGIFNGLGLGARIALSPIAALAQGAAFLTAGKRGKAIKDARRGFRQNIDQYLEDDWAAREAAGEDFGLFQKTRERFDAYFGFKGSAANKYVHDVYLPEVEAKGGHANALGWLDEYTIGARKAKNDRRDFRNAERNWGNVIGISKDFSRKYGGREVELTKSEFRKYRNQFIEKGGIDPNLIKTNDDLMQLIYNKKAFIKNAGGDKSKFGFMNTMKAYRDPASNPDESRHREVIDVLEEIRDNTDRTADAAETQEMIEHGVEREDIQRLGNSPKAQTSLIRRLFNKGKAGIFAGLNIRRRREEAEQEHATAGTTGNGEQEGLNDSVGSNSGASQSSGKKPNFLKRLLSGGMKLFGAITDTKVGGFIWNGIKLFGGIGLLGTIGFTIAELISPGLVAKMSGKIQKAQDYVDKDPAGGFGGIFIRIRDKVTEFWENKAMPAASNFLGNIIPNKIAPKFEELGSKIINIIPTAGAKLGDWIEKNFTKITGIVRDVTTSLVGPTAKLMIAVVKGLATGLWDYITKGNGMKSAMEGNLTDAEVEFNEAIGKNIQSQDMGSAATASEAKAIADSIGLTNASIEKGADGQYHIMDRQMLGNRDAMTENGSIRTIRDTGGLETSARTIINLANPLTHGAAMKGLTRGGGIGAKLAMAPVKGAMKLASRIPGIGLASRAAGATVNVTERGAAAVANAAQRAAGTAARDAARAGSGKVVKTVAETGTYTLLKSLCSALETLALKLMDSEALSKVIRKLAKNPSDGFGKSVLKKVGNLLLRMIRKIAGFTGKSLGKLVEALEAGLAKLGGKSAAQTAFAAIFITSGAVFGAIDAANLFGVDANDVDATMRIVSAIMGAFVNIPWIGTFFDVMSAILQGFLKINLKQDLATLIYTMLVGKKSEAYKKFELSKEQQEMERQLYNAINGTNLDTDAYNDLDNMTTMGKVINGAKGLITGNKTVTTKQTSEKALQLLSSRYSATEINSMMKDPEALAKALKDVGYYNLGGGPGLHSRVDRSNPNSQGYWGRNMERYGCGPTAFASAVQDITHAGINPGVMGVYAAKNGWFNSEGTNSGLFTDGAAALGIKSTYVGKSNLRDSLKSGNPTIVSYTRPDGSRHIVKLRGYANGKTILTDPLNGQPTLTNASDFTNATINAAYNLGTGLEPNRNYIVPVGTAFKPDMFANAIASGATDSKNKPLSSEQQKALSVMTSLYNLGQMVDGNGKPVSYATYIATYDAHKRFYQELANDGITGITNPSFFTSGSSTSTSATSTKSGSKSDESIAALLRRAQMGRDDNSDAWKQLAATTVDINSTAVFRQRENGMTWKQIYQNNTKTQEAIKYWSSDEGKAKMESIAETVATNAEFVASPNWGRNEVFADIGSGTSIFQKLMKFAKLLGAVPKAIMNGTSVWEEYGKLVAGDNSIEGYANSGVISASNGKALSGDAINQAIWNHLRGMGMSPTSAAATMGVWKSESSLNPMNLEAWYVNKERSSAAMNDNSLLSSYTTDVVFPAYANSNPPISIDRNEYKGSDGRYYPGLGLAQWTGNRTKNLIDFSNANRLPWSNLDNQLAFFSKEMSERDKNLINTMNNSDINSATLRFADSFENNHMGDSGIKERRKNAKDIYNAFKNLDNSLGTGRRGFRKTLQGPTALGYGPSIKSAIANTKNAYDNFLVHLGLKSVESAGSSASGGFTPVWTGSASSGQQAVVDKMNSIYGKINYGLGSVQDPDRGTASCASTVSWAYRKALGVTGLSSNSTEQAKNSQFATIWTNDGSSSFPMNRLQPGDILYQNWGQTRNNGKMSHTEMYAGNGYDLSHGGNPRFGPTQKALNDYRQKHTMMIRRYKGFMNGNLGTGPRMSSLSNDSMGRSFATDVDRTLTSTGSFNDSLGGAPAVSMDGTETRLEKILTIMMQWYQDMKNRSEAGNVAIFNQNNAINAAAKEAAKPAPPQVQTKLKQLERKHQMFASV